MLVNHQYKRKYPIFSDRWKYDPEKQWSFRTENEDEGKPRTAEGGGGEQLWENVRGHWASDCCTGFVLIDSVCTHTNMWLHIPPRVNNSVYSLYSNSGLHCPPSWASAFDLLGNPFTNWEWLSGYYVCLNHCMYSQYNDYVV